VSVLSRALFAVAGGALAAAAVLPVAATAAPIPHPQFTMMPSASASPAPLPSPEPTPGLLEGRIWLDTNANGVADKGEAPVAGVRIVAVPGPVSIDALLAGKAIPGAVETTSQDNGIYGLAHLKGPKVTVYAVPEAASRLRLTKQVSTPADGNSDFTGKAVTSDGSPRYYGVRTGVIVGADKSAELDAGLVAIPRESGVACIRAWNDTNRDGIRGGGENPIAGLPAFVLPAPAAPAPSASPAASGTGTALRSLVRRSPSQKPAADVPVTNADGELCTDGLRPGKYFAYLGLGPVVIVGGKADIKPVWTLTKQDQGSNDAIDSDFGKPGAEVPPAFANKFVTVALTVSVQKPVVVDGGLFKNGVHPTPSPSAGPSTQPSASPSAPAGGGSLPTTGAAVGGFLAAGALLVGGGIALTVITRRRRSLS
jgi:hypothetical protein